MPEMPIRSMRIAMAQVLRNGPREEPRLLGHVGDARPQVRLRELAHVHAAKQQPAGRHVVEAQEHLGDGGFAGTRVADDGASLAASQGEVQVVQSILVRIVKTERDVVKARHLRVGACALTRAPLAQHRRRRRVPHLGRQVDHLARATKARQRARHREHGELGHHVEEHDEHGVLNQRRDGADLHGMHAHAVGTQPNDEHLDPVHQEERKRIRRREHEVHADGVIGVVRERAVQLAFGHLLAPKGPHHAHAGYGLAQAHVHTVDEGLQAREDGR